ncbi:MAG: DUF86 domain-containing protein [Candidatus Riflebacteria bacterium]|nr:DUF86 domain-containing protein [Candidatus Riflebacteria bacterium]
MGLDRAYVMRAIADLRRWVVYLRDLGPLDSDQLQRDLTRQLALLHALQIAIHLVLDLGAHVLADLKTGSIDEYSEIGPRLAAAGVVPTTLGENLGSMARFRNLLVHRYHEIDLSVVVRNLPDGLDDFDLFAVSILKLLPP